MSIGFGLERIGFLCFDRPRMSAILLLAFTILCVFQFPKLNIDGEILRIFAGDNDIYNDYVNMRETFGTFEDDAFLIVQSDDITDPAQIERLRELNFDLELNEFAEGVLSPFALRKPIGDGITEPAISENMQTRAQVLEKLHNLRSSDPILHNLILNDFSGFIFIMFPQNEVLTEQGETAMIASLRDLVKPYRQDGFDILLTGPSFWKEEVLDATLSDQTVFVAAGVFLGFLTAFVVFRSFWGALLATLPPLISVVWVLGVVTLLFGSFTYLTNVLLALVLVISFAESLFFCLHWQRLVKEGQEAKQAIRQTLARVSPACALTSITTMIAFATLSWAGNQGIYELSITGMTAIFIAFLALVLFLPLALKIALRIGYVPRRNPSLAVTALVPPAKWLATHRAKPISITAIIIFIMVLYPHFALEPKFSFKDFLPKKSGALDISKQIDAGVGGVAPIYVSIKLQDGQQDMTDRDFDRISQVHILMEEIFGARKVISMHSFAYYLESGFSKTQIFSSVGDYLRSRFVTDDWNYALATGFIPATLQSDEIRDIVNRTKAELDKLDLADDVKITGFQVVTSFESVNMINRLREGLTVAVIISIFLIGFAFRSVPVAVISIIPNFLPILGTELFLYLSGAGLQMTTVVALTIAFGIAVDDTIHFLNQYKAGRDEGLEHNDAVMVTLEKIGPALVATTAILCAGTATVIFSSLPQIALFGTLSIMTLILALLGDMFILPALIIAGGRVFKRNKRCATKKEKTS